MEIEICLRCKKEVSNETKKCECGGHNFVIGNLKIENNKISCICGNETFKQSSHSDYTDKAISTLICNKCGKACSNVYYRTEEDMLYWNEY